MNLCPRHLRRRVIGYCYICGSFGCDLCLTEYEGAYYCSRDYKPIAEKLDHERKLKESMARRERQRLVVHGKDGAVVMGVCFALNPAAEGFHLELVDRHGQPEGRTAYLSYSDLKAVYYVKSFDGRFDPDQHHQEWVPGGSSLVVEFKDGEIFAGKTLNPYRGDEPRLQIVPGDPESNNVSVLVERSALAAIYTPEEYKKKQHREFEEFVRERQGLGLPKEELLGDFFFDHKEYVRALKHYRVVEREDSDSPSIRKKLICCHYNIGVGYVKHHDYERALRAMRTVLEMDPENARAQDKARKLEELVGSKKAAT